MRAIEHLQLDPLVILARSHDLMLHSRVEGYRPELFEELTYQDREFFDWGGWLAVRPMEELPYWRVLMRRGWDHGNLDDTQGPHPEAVAEMRALLTTGAQVSSRELEASGTETRKTYRGTKARALALYYLWRTGEAMTHHRNGFERVYASTESIAPADLMREVDDREAELFVARKAIAADGIARIPPMSYLFERKLSRADHLGLEEELVERGELVRLEVEGWRGAQLMAAGDLPLLERLQRGETPTEWEPTGPSPLDEVVFFSPLDPLVARGRAKQLFGFEHVWEIYKKPEDVRFGRFTMPMLWGEELVGRMDAKLDRGTSTLVVNGIWLEDPTTALEPELARALSAGIERLMSFLNSTQIDVAAVKDPQLREALARTRPAAEG
jgi:uncharacterized protein YcaQ